MAVQQLQLQLQQKKKKKLMHLLSLPSAPLRSAWLIVADCLKICAVENFNINTEFITFFDRKMGLKKWESLFHYLIVMVSRPFLLLLPLLVMPPPLPPVPLQLWLPHPVDYLRNFGGVPSAMLLLANHLRSSKNFDDSMLVMFPMLTLPLEQPHFAAWYVLDEYDRFFHMHHSLR